MDDSDFYDCENLEELTTKPFLRQRGSELHKVKKVLYWSEGSK